MLEHHRSSLILATALIFPALTGQESMPQIGISPDDSLLERLHKMSRKAPITVAHRGDSKAFPENTLPAFQSAVQVGAQMVELDFRQTSDGILVCMHDEKLDRTTDSESALGKKGLKTQAVTSTAIAKLDAGSYRGKRHAGTKVPTLAEALDVIQTKSVTMIEHKQGDAQVLVKLLRSKKLEEQVLVQSFHWDWLREYHKLEPSTLIAALGSGELSEERLASLKQTGAKIVHWNYRDLSLENISKLHNEGFLVCVYTVDPDVTLVGAAAAGIDLVTTNRPGRMRELVKRGDLARSE